MANASLVQSYYYDKAQATVRNKLDKADCLHWLYTILELSIWINSVTVIASLLGEAGKIWVLIWGDHLAVEVTVDWSHIRHGRLSSYIRRRCMNMRS